MAKKTERSVASETDGPFNAVKCFYNDKYTTHVVYGDNAPYLRPSEGAKFSRREAIWIADSLNEKIARAARKAA